MSIAALSSRVWTFFVMGWSASILTLNIGKDVHRVTGISTSGVCECKNALDIQKIYHIFRYYSSFASVGICIFAYYCARLRSIVAVVFAESFVKSCLAKLHLDEFVQIIGY